MNTADPFQSVVSALWSHQMGMADTGDWPSVTENWWDQPSGPYYGGAVSTNTLAGNVTITGSTISAAPTNTLAGNVTFTGSTISAAPTNTLAGNVTFTGSTISAAPTNTLAGNVTFTGSTISSMSTTGLMKPERPPLEVRRYYHWNKSATAGAVGTSGTRDTAHAHAIPDVLVVIDKEREARGVTESEAVQKTEYGHQRGPMRGTILSPRSLTWVAVILAGQKRGAVDAEWRCHLLGESDHRLTQREQIRAARGFVWAAVRYRLQDAADLAWRANDAVLKSHTLSNLAIWVPVLLTAFAIVRHDGLYGLVTYDINLIELGGGIYGAIRFGRHRRGVKPPKRNPGQVKE